MTHHGTPITKELATELRQLVFGTSAAPPRGEWTRTGLVFGPPSQDEAYGLRSQRNGTRGLHSVLQGFIIKYLLFDRRASGRKVSTEDLLRPTAQLQSEALLASMAEILLIIAEKSKVVVVLPGDQAYIAHSITYFQDSVTEKFTEDPGPGALLFLYCAVFTRTLSKVRTDLDAMKGSYLVGPLEEGSLNIVMLLLTGRATPYLHNGVLYAGDEQNYAIPQYGVLNRSALGLLLWESDSKFNCAGRQPGSRLKTPSLPIWITLCGTHYGVLFNTNPDLLRNYHAESRFDLHYYNGSGSHIVVTVDNKHQHDKASFMLQRQGSSHNKDQLNHRREEPGTTPLERLIHTKWEEASIRCQSQPMTLSYLFNMTS